MEEIWIKKTKFVSRKLDKNNKDGDMLFCTYKNNIYAASEFVSFNIGLFKLSTNNVKTNKIKNNNLFKRNVPSL